jgi:hypothetical protein
VVEIYLPEVKEGRPVTAVTLDVAGLLEDKNQVTVTVNSTKLMIGVLKLVEISLGGKKDGGASEVADGSLDSDGRPDGVEGGDVPTDADVAAGDLPLKGQGQKCAVADECEGGLCVDGICCLSTCGTCNSCDVPGSEGTCVLSPLGRKTTACADLGVDVPCGYNGTCDGKGGCFRPLAGQMCKPGSCQGTTLVPPSVCDGLGACAVPINVNCAPYQCSAAAAAAHCGTSCQAQTDCAAGAQCTNKSCGQPPKKGNGAGCVMDSECTSNFCADGVCCGARCNTQCMSCNQTGQLGNCRAVAAGQPDPRGICIDAGAASCGTNGRCATGAGCARYPAGTVCQTAQCSAQAVIGVRKCDATGTCAPAANLECDPYRCNPVTTSCFTSCTVDTQCARATGKSCKNGICR